MKLHVTLVSGVNLAAPQAGGTRSYVLGLAERLAARQIGVSLVARGNSSNPIDGVRYIPVRSGPSSVRFLLRLTAKSLALPIPDDSIIHAQRPDDLVPFAFAKRQNPAICTLHGAHGLAVRRRRGSGYSLLYGALERIGLRRAHRVIAVDPGTARWYTNQYSWLAKRTTVIPVAVDLRRFRPLDKEGARRHFRIEAERVLLYAGRLSVEKHVEAIIRALASVSRTELLIAGGGPEEPGLRALADGAPVRFLGPVSHESMPPLLNAADLVVLPSEYEGLPTIALEALACGVPVVATPVGALPEIVVPGRTGWLVSDIAHLGPVIAEALPKAAGMKANCVAAVRPFDWDNVLDRILMVYRDAEAEQ